MESVIVLAYYLAVGLLAILIAIYVFAVTQIGKATETMSIRQRDILNQQKESKEEQIEKMQEQLDEARKKVKLIKKN